MFASQKYPSLSGTNLPRDFVEFPSQINEHWALDPVVLKNYALHYETKQPIPQTLVDKIKKAATFNPVSYTHLDVYKRQSDDPVTPTVNELDGLNKIKEVSNDTHVIELYSASGTTKMGYNLSLIHI